MAPRVFDNGAESHPGHVLDSFGRDSSYKYVENSFTASALILILSISDSSMVNSGSNDNFQAQQQLWSGYTSDRDYPVPAADLLASFQPSPIVGDRELSPFIVSYDSDLIDFITVERLRDYSQSQAELERQIYGNHPMHPRPFHNDNSPAYSMTPLDSLPSTPEFKSLTPDNVALGDHIMSQFPNTPIDGMTNIERPNICVDTSLLFVPSSGSNYGNNLVPGAQENSPGLLSPNSSILDNEGSMQQPLQRRHSHSRSAGDMQYFKMEHGIPAGGSGRGRGHNRANSAPTSRHNSPYARALSVGGAASDVFFETASPAVGHTDQGHGYYNPSEEPSPISPSDSEFSFGRRVVATDKIRQASMDRRKYPVRYVSFNLAIAMKIFSYKFKLSL